jgi:phosphocarrier protein HPr
VLLGWKSNLEIAFQNRTWRYFMFQKEVVITSPVGLDTRPAAQFVKEAKGFMSDITVTCNGKSVSAKSLFKLQTLALSHGTVATISAEGSDEQQAVEHLTGLLTELG